MLEADFISFLQPAFPPGIPHPAVCLHPVWMFECQLMSAHLELSRLTFFFSFFLRVFLCCFPRGGFLLHFWRLNTLADALFWAVIGRRRRNDWPLCSVCVRQRSLCHTRSQVKNSKCKMQRLKKKKKKTSHSTQPNRNGQLSADLAHGQLRVTLSGTETNQALNLSFFKRVEKSAVDPDMTWRLRVLTPCTVENPHLPFDSPQTELLITYC